MNKIILLLPLIFLLGCTSYNVPEAPKGQLHIHLNQDQQSALISVLHRYSSPDFYFAPSILSNKLNNARASCFTPHNEEVLVLVDATSFGSAKNCLLVGSSGVYFRNSTTPSKGRHFWSYDKFRDIEFSKNGPFHISIGGPSFNRAAVSMSKNKLIKFLQDIQNCIRGFELPNGPAEVDLIPVDHEIKTRKVRGDGGWKIIEGSNQYATRNVSFGCSGMAFNNFTGKDGFTYGFSSMSEYYPKFNVPWIYFTFCPEGGSQTINLAGKKFKATALSAEDYQALRRGTTQPARNNRKNVTHMETKAKRTNTSDGVSSEIVVTSTKRYLHLSGTTTQTESEIAAIELERQKANEKRTTKLKGYKTDELTHDQFEEDGWKFGECKYGRIGILESDPAWCFKDCTYVIGYFDIPASATYEEGLDEDKEREALLRVGGKYIQNFYGAPKVVICELVFFGSDTESKGALKSINWH